MSRNQFNYYLYFDIIQINSNEYSKREILEEFKIKFDLNNNIEGNLRILEDGQIQLQYFFPDAESFSLIYKKNLKFFERLIEIIDDGQLTAEDAHYLFKDENEENTAKNFLIFRITTNWKDPIRKNYKFTFKIADLLKLGINFEEIENGFLIFYETYSLFKFLQINHINYEIMKKWNENNNPQSEKFQILLDKLLNK